MRKTSIAILAAVSAFLIFVIATSGQTESSVSSDFLGGIVDDADNKIAHETTTVAMESTNFVTWKENGWYVFDVNLTPKTDTSSWDFIVESTTDITAEFDVWENATRTVEETTCSTSEVPHPNGTTEAVEGCSVVSQQVIGFGWTIHETQHTPGTLQYATTNILIPKNEQLKSRVRIKGFPRGNVYKFNFYLIPSGISIAQAETSGIGGGLDPSAQGSLKPVGLWNLSSESIDDSNNTVLDRSGNLINLYNGSGSSPSAVEIVTGPEGRNYSAINFDTGVQQDYLFAEDTGLLDLTGDFSISFWAHYDQTGGTLAIMEKFVGSAAYGTAVLQHSDARLRLNQDIDSFSATNTNTGGWFHWVVTHNASDKATFYINGSFDNQATHASNPVNTDGRWTVGGRQGDDGTIAFNGQLACVQLYNFTLNETEVNSLYEDPDCKSLDELVAPPPEPETLSIPVIEFPLSGIVTNLHYLNVSNVSPAHTWHYYQNGTEISAFSSAANTTLALTGSEANYVINVSVTNNTDWTENVSVSFTHDNLTPAIDFADNTPTSEAVSDSILVNVTTSDGTDTSAIIDFNYSLVGWWRFENIGSTTANDTSTYGSDGDINGAAYSYDGVRGLSLSFDGVDDYVDLGQDRFQYPSVTVTGWMKVYSDPATGTQNEPTFFGITDNAADDRLLIRYDNERVGFYDDINDAGTGNTSTINVSLNTWFHIGFTCDGTSGKKLYTNGVLGAVTANTNCFDQIQNADVITLGVYGGVGAGGLQDYLNGSIDDVQVFSRVLSGQEINASYNNGLYRLERDFADLALGVYNFTGYVVDSAGNLNQTEERSVEFAYASEAEGDAAIATAISGSVPSATSYQSQQVYVVNSSNDQFKGIVDYLVVQTSPQRRWILNYVTAGENYLNAPNLSSAVYVLELADMTAPEITQAVGGLLNNTK